MFLLEVTDPHAPDDRNDQRYECTTVHGLARRVEEATGMGAFTAFEIAIEAARGEDFTHEDIETGRVVTARAIERAEA